MPKVCSWCYPRLPRISAELTLVSAVLTYQSLNSSLGYGADNSQAKLLKLVGTDVTVCDKQIHPHVHVFE